MAQDRMNCGVLIISTSEINRFFFGAWDSFRSGFSPAVEKFLLPLPTWEKGGRNGLTIVAARVKDPSPHR